MAITGMSGRVDPEAFSHRPQLLPRLAVSPDGLFVAALRQQPGSEDMFSGGFTQVIELETGKEIGTVAKHRFVDIAYSPDGRRLALTMNRFALPMGPALDFSRLISEIFLYDAVTLEKVEFRR